MQDTTQLYKNQARNTRNLSPVARAIWKLPYEEWIGLSRLRLAKRLGYSERQITYGREELVEKGWCELVKLPNKNRANEKYRLRRIPMEIPELPMREDAFTDLSLEQVTGMCKMDMIEYYLSIGIPVLPLQYPVQFMGATFCSCKSDSCARVGKHPIPVRWKAENKAKFLLPKVKDYWSKRRGDPERNVGLMTQDFLALDIDPRHGGNISLAVCEEELGELPRTTTQETGSGGEHRLFRTSRPVRNSVSHIAEGIDTRGMGGYIVSAPSVHPSGGYYRWKDWTGLADFPETWMDTLDAPTTGERIVRPGRKTGRGVDRRIPLDAHTPFGEGVRNDTLYRYAAKARMLGSGYHDILKYIQDINEKLSRPPLEYSELMAIANSAKELPTGKQENK